MAFGRRKQKEQAPPVPGVDWRGVWRFTVGMIEREILVKSRKQFTRGPRAIRVPSREGAGRVFAPCAYFGPKGVDDLDSVIYEDAEFQRLLCALDQPIERNGEDVYYVRDARSEVIGVVRRIPPANRLVRHTWRIDQPGRPVIAGCNKWAKKDAKEIAEVALESTVGFLLRSSGDGSYSRDRELEWRSEGGEFVMESCGFGGHDMRLEIEIEARWLDRRLAFAYAMLRDVPPV